jgi:hypothetical protein
VADTSVLGAISTSSVTVSVTTRVTSTSTVWGSAAQLAKNKATKLTMSHNVMRFILASYRGTFVGYFPNETGGALVPFGWRLAGVVAQYIAPLQLRSIQLQP